MGHLLFAGLSLVTLDMVLRDHPRKQLSLFQNAETSPSDTNNHSVFIVTLIAFLPSLESTVGEVIRSISPHLNAVFGQMDIVCIKMSAQPIHD